MNGSDVHGREFALATTFVAIADTLVRDYDVTDLFDRLTVACVELLGAESAGLMIAGHDGLLHLVASSTESTRELELFELSSGEGPCLECYARQEALVMDTADTLARWPRFAGRAAEAGVTKIQAVPMRLRQDTIGALNIFHVEGHDVSPHDTALAQALADIATIALLQRRAADRSDVLTEQLQTALNDRIVIEQAKGALAERAQVPMDVAFGYLRDFCRDRRIPITQTAREVVTGQLDIDDLLAHRWPRSL